MNITLLFYLPRTRFQRLICFLGRMRFIHVIVAYPLGYTDSTPRTGVRKKSSAPPSDDVVGVFLYIPQDVSSPNKWVDAWVDKEIGIKYGYWDCVQAFIRRWTGLRVGGNPGGLECAEYAARFLYDNGGPRLAWDYGLTPDELYEAVRL